MSSFEVVRKKLGYLRFFGVKATPTHPSLPPSFEVTMWLQQLDQQETDREMIPDIVEELRGCLEEVANNDPDLHELKPLKHSAVEAVRSVLLGGKLCLACSSDRRERALIPSATWPVPCSTGSVYERSV